ncbi:trehalose-6-phosphate synthase [Rhodanobacter lindaniclasticus]
MVTRRGRTLVDVFPLGIDVENFRAFAQSQGSQEALQRISQQEYSRRKLLIGIDPLDYAEGIPRSSLEVLANFLEEVS